MNLFSKERERENIEESVIRKRRHGQTRQDENYEGSTSTNDDPVTFHYTRLVHLSLDELNN